MKLWIFEGGGGRNTGLFYRIISKHSLLFLSQDTELEYFWGLLTFNYFGGYA